MTAVDGAASARAVDLVGYGHFTDRPSLEHSDERGISTSDLPTASVSLFPDGRLRLMPHDGITCPRQLTLAAAI